MRICDSIIHWILLGTQNTPLTILAANPPIQFFYHNRWRTPIYDKNIGSKRLKVKLDKGERKSVCKDFPSDFAVSDLHMSLLEGVG